MAKARTESDLRAALTKGKDPRELPWYKTDFEEVPEPGKTILENYSKIPPDQVLQHVKDVVGSVSLLNANTLIYTLSFL